MSEQQTTLNIACSRLCRAKSGISEAYHTLQDSAERVCATLVCAACGLAVCIEQHDEELSVRWHKDDPDGWGLGECADADVELAARK